MNSDPYAIRPQKEPAWQSLLPALLIAILIVLISALSVQLASLPLVHALGIGALPVSIMLGMMMAALPVVERLRQQPAAFRVQRVAQKQLLQWGIVLFGLQLNLSDLAAVGWQALVADITTIAVILPLGIVLGWRVLKMSLSLTLFLSVGSAVCGAAAILAAAPVLGRYLRDGESEDQLNQSAGLAVSAVAVFGTLSVLLYPQVQHWLALPADVSGVYIGSTIHEVAQAVAATDAADTATRHNAVIVKLMRVVMLAPVLIALALWLQKIRPAAGAAEPAPARASVPGFIVMFLLVVVLNSVLALMPDSHWLALVHTLAMPVSATLLAFAMAALGLNIHWRDLLQAGWRPVVLALLLWLILLLGGALLCRLLMAGG